MLQEKLKNHTADAHSGLEQQMYVDLIMQRTLTSDQYQKLLITNYLVHLYFEQPIFNALGNDIANELNLPDREKLSALEKDMQHEQIDKEALLRRMPVDRPEIRNRAFAVGAMYVLEGATLGGSMIVKQLKLNRNFPDDHPFYYYGCYGSDLMTKWKSFLAVINELPEEEHEEALAGAEFMFREISAIARKAESLSA